MIGFGSIGARFWRTLLSVVVAYAVAAQSLLIAVAGFSLPADAGQNAPAFELCLHDQSGAPELPRIASSALPGHIMRSSALPLKSSTASMSAWWSCRGAAAPPGCGD